MRVPNSWMVYDWKIPSIKGMITRVIAPAIRKIRHFESETLMGWPGDPPKLHLHCDCGQITDLVKGHWRFWYQPFQPMCFDYVQIDCWRDVTETWFVILGLWLGECDLHTFFGSMYYQCGRHRDCDRKFVFFCCGFRSVSCLPS